MSATRVYVFGAGKVGATLARAAKARGMTVTLRAAREGLPKRVVDAELLILAVRDREIAATAEAFANAHRVGENTAVAHVAGAHDARLLAPLAGLCAGVAQMHPLLAFASAKKPPALPGGYAHVRGDAVAVRRATTFVRALGMTPCTFETLDAVGYHAAAGLVANGAAALAAKGVELLTLSGVPEHAAPRLLGALLRSVADNVAALGFPAALTGPVRRGDRAAVEAHLGIVRAKLPSAVALYLAIAEAQIPLARAIGDASSPDLDALEAWISSAKIR